MSAFEVTNSEYEPTTVMLVAPDARNAAPSDLPIMTAGILSSKPAERAIAVGSPATLLTTSTPTAPAAFALATFWLNTQLPRLMTATLPAAATSTDTQPLFPV